MSSEYIPVAEDIEWLRDEWWVRTEALSDAELRRGSATLRSLLVEGNIQVAWRHHGFDGQPSVCGPDMEAIAVDQGLKLEHAASLVAGGGRLNGVDASMIGGFRVFNPATGKGPDDESGFAVAVYFIARDATRWTTLSPLDCLVERSWRLNDYLDAYGAVRKGERLSRREIIQYFANYAGGAHLDLPGRFKRKKTPRYEFIAELRQRVRADIKDGLHFELLSIGQAVGRSPDMQALATRIRARARQEL
jgi:hypothetical protein